MIFSLLFFYTIPIRKTDYTLSVESGYVRIIHRRTMLNSYRRYATDFRLGQEQGKMYILCDSLNTTDFYGIHFGKRNRFSIIDGGSHVRCAGQDVSWSVSQNGRLWEVMDARNAYTISVSSLFCVRSDARSTCTKTPVVARLPRGQRIADYLRIHPMPTVQRACSAKPIRERWTGTRNAYGILNDNKNDIWITTACARLGRRGGIAKRVRGHRYRCCCYYCCIRTILQTVRPLLYVRTYTRKRAHTSSLLLYIRKYTCRLFK